MRGLPQSCLWAVDNPHPALSLPPVSSLATCLTCANTEVGMIQLNPIFQPFSSAATLTSMASGGTGMYKWVGGGRGKTKSPAPLRSSVKLGYRKLTRSRSQDGEEKMGLDSRSLAPGSRRPPCQQDICRKDPRASGDGKMTHRSRVSRDSPLGCGAQPGVCPGPSPHLCCIWSASGPASSLQAQLQSAGEGGAAPSVGPPPRLGPCESCVRARQSGRGWPSEGEMPISDTSKREAAASGGLENTIAADIYFFFFFLVILE